MLAEQPGWAPAGWYDLATGYSSCGACLHQCPSAGPVARADAGGAHVVIDCSTCDVTRPTTVGCYAGECTLPPN